VPVRRYSKDELEAAVGSLIDSARFREAEEIVATAAPGLQRILAEALAAGGWFEESHHAAVQDVADAPEGEQRVAAIRTLLAEESRISMMVGVAVGWALAGELGATETDEEE
jgi:hypothetical protein